MVEYPTGTLSIFGGFCAKPLCQSLNYLQSLVVETYSLTIDSTDVPGRAYHGCTVFKEKMWIYGGTDNESKLKDLWQYDGEWTKVET